MSKQPELLDRTTSLVRQGIYFAAAKQDFLPSLLVRGLISKAGHESFYGGADPKRVPNLIDNIIIAHFG